MSARDKIDPESLPGLDALLAAVPGGFGAFHDPMERRARLATVLAASAAGMPANDRVVTTDRVIPGPLGAPDTQVRIYRPVGVDGALPGIVYIHGGGMSTGTIDGEDAIAAMYCEQLQCVVVSLEYRLAPENPYPAQIEDCYAGLQWTGLHADEIGLDRERLAVYGGSAGGNLAIAMALLARDRGTPNISFCMALYPMVDDSSTLPSTQEITDIGVWDRGTSIEAWEWYLGGRPADGYAAPLRNPDLSDFPPTYLDVGEVDLVRDETLAFASRLLHAGIPVELHVSPGSYHASEIFSPGVELSDRIWALRIDAFKRAFGK